ncbi:AraC family transcriptional regulator [Paracoccus aminophilus]|uniref:Transcriptional regulator, AraC family n=1 Tax=Paracoccus aminophilus JCM 7686 TaxID=1367847 RepID=S5XX21_PARAH|nr:helix-turn-helix transcriptional regulator [Paracoccus aminophilus]AGT09862.1 transcriptional regulator, AraC family [Paracoccus aminophilus JCM 7686]
MLEELRTRHLAHHDTSRAMAAMEVCYPDGTSTGWHSHPRGQLLHAISGVMVVHAAQGAWVVPPNRALWLEAGLEHEVHMTGEVRIHTVFLADQQIPGLPARTSVLAVSPLLREVIVAAVRLPPDAEESARAGLLLGLLVDELTVSDVLPLHLPMPKDERLRQICRSLQEAPADSRTAEAWGASLGFSGKTVHRLFAREVQMSFAQWREQARLLAALTRLAAGARIIDTAFDCGYASQSAFTAMFRRHFGVPPSAYPLFATKGAAEGDP